MIRVITQHLLKSLTIFSYSCSSNYGMQPTSKYNDIKFFLVAIVFINAFNYYLTYSNIRFNWYTLFTFINDTVQGWIAWWIMRTIIIYLDRKMPYGQHPLRRILAQLVLTSLAALGAIILLTELSSWIVKGRPAIVSFYLFDIFIILVWFFVINGIYVGMHYYYEWKQSEGHRSSEKQLRTSGFFVKHGNQNMLLSFEEIAGFYVENGYTVLLSWQNRKYLPDKSLDKIEPLLPEEFFFRLNRQYLLHRKAIKGFKRIGDGKLEVLVEGPGDFPASVSVSRTRAVSFKNWFDPI
jgi:DNA-binding LytR/AlgR family response regulator